MRLFCFLLGHQYKLVTTWNFVNHEVRCPRCNGHWAMNDEVKAFVPWSGEFERMKFEHKELTPNE